MDHPEPISTKRTTSIPQCRKGFTIDEAKAFVVNVMDVFRSVDDMNDLRTMYETGKQLSRAYFDCHLFRAELAQHLTTLDYPSFASKMMKKLNNMGVFKNDDIWFSSFYFYNTTWNFSETWPEFATALALAGLPNLLNLNIGHQPYLDNLASKNVYYLIKASLSIIHNIARVPGNVHYFATDAVKQALVHLSQREEEFLRCVSTLCLAYIVSDNEMQLLHLNSANDSLKSLLSYISTARASEKRRCHGFQVAELLSALAVLSVNDSIKSNILSSTLSGGPNGHYTCVSMLKEIVEAAANDNTTPALQRECEEAVKILTSLCLDSSSLASYMTQLENWAMDRINSSNFANLSKPVARCLKAIAWRMSYAGQPSAQSTAPTTGLVLLSYAPANKAAVMKIADRLEENGFPVWTSLTPEVFSVSESCALGLSGVAASSASHENWLTALESASIVVMCISDVYRLSPICRMEAWYLNELMNENKHLIVVNLQSKYKASGWLSHYASNAKHMLDFSGKRDVEATYQSLSNITSDAFQECKKYAAKINNDNIKTETKSPQAKTTGQIMENSNHIDEKTKATKAATVNAAAPRDSSLPPSTAGVQNHGKQISSMPSVKLPSGTLNTALLQPGAKAWRKVVRPEVRNWSTSDVSSWFKFRGLSLIPAGVVGGLDGVMLSQLAALRVSSPDFFCQSLREDFKLAFGEMLRLFEALDELAPEILEEGEPQVHVGDHPVARLAND